MSALATPKHDVRKLRFSTGAPHLQSPFPGVAPSPYTPFSGRRSGSVPIGTPQLPTRSTSFEADALTTLPQGSAEEFINGGLDAALRESSLDVLAGLRTQYESGTAQAADAFVKEMISTLALQLERANELMDAPSLHPYVRKQVRALQNRLLLEQTTWNLVDTAWRPSEIRSRDLSTTRLAPSNLDENSVLKVPGYVKCQRIVEWLETTAADVLGRSGGPKVKPLDDPAYRWEYTASKYEGEKVSMDFPHAVGKSLDEVETKAEGRISHEIFRLVRAGKLSEAEELCRRVGQPWRAAALAGGKKSSALSANGIKGDARRTWRIAAKAIARSPDPAILPHERAVYGVLAGELEPVLAVSTTFEDEAWARLCTLLDSTAEFVLNGRNVTVAAIEDETVLQIFRECKHAGEGLDVADGKVLEGIRMTRAFVGIGPGMCGSHVSQLLKTLGELAEAGASSGEEWICRFAAHACIFLKTSGMLAGVKNRPQDEFSFDTAIEKYVEVVLQKDQEREAKARAHGTILPPRRIVPETAARYLAELHSDDRIISTYSVLLCAALEEDLSHERAEAKRVGVSPRQVDERRTLCLQKAGQCFPREILDLLVVAATDKLWKSMLPDQVDNSLFSDDIKLSESVSDEVSETDELVVRAIEFLIFPAFANYKEALLRVTNLARQFFLRGRRAATRYVISWAPEEVMSQIEPSTCEGPVHELESWRVYMDAISRHNEWKTYQSRKPQPISEKIRAAASAEPGEVSYEIQANAGIQVQKFNKENEEFLRTSERYCQAAVQSLEAALLLEGGWMQDKYKQNENVAERPRGGYALRHRSKEIEAIRKFGIPQLAVLLHHVYHESGMFTKAIGLAQVVASDHLKLYECFGVSEMKSFLTRIADSTVLHADTMIQSGQCERPYETTMFEELPANE